MRRLSRSGFTLMELLVVIAVIGLLSGIAVVSLNKSRAKARDAKRKADLQQLDTAIQFYISSNPTLGLPAIAGWCARITPTAIGSHNGYADFRDAIVPKFMAQLPLDPTYGNKAGDYYFYNINDSSDYTLLSVLENASDPNYALYHISTSACNLEELLGNDSQFNYMIGVCRANCTKR